LNIILKKTLKILKWTGIIILGLTVILLTVHFIGKHYNNRTPDGGINETMYIDVNGQEQWINIYGENKDNPVMLYLHGGPGYSTSFIDWPALRKLAKDYTIVNWDQRNSGLTWIHDPKYDGITPEMMRQDIDYVVEYILNYMGKEKLTLLGMSWGSMYGGDYATRHPEKIDCFICISASVDEYAEEYINEAILDYVEGRIDFREAVNTYGNELFLFRDPFEATEDISGQKKYYEAQKTAWHELYQNDEEAIKLLEDYDPTVYVEYFHNPEDEDLKKKVDKTEETEKKLWLKHGYDPDALFDDADYSPIAAMVFNPYYSLWDWIHFDTETIDDDTYEMICADFPLSEITDFEMPVYILQGNKDCQCGALQKYFEQVNAPDKEFRMIEGGHSSTLAKSEELAEFIHEIAEKQQAGK